jgi:Ca2+-binding RTX toxin-like protein
MITSGYGDFNGDAGTDTMIYSYVRSGMTVTLDGKKNDHCSGCDNHFVHADIENVIGSQFDDRIYGNESANELSGEAGNDLLLGNGGDDYLDAGHGESQKEYGGPGVDTCVGYNLAVRDSCEH